ncbi:hypothetical protein LCGC14_0420390 [marine sediment metagenome]|uniref:ASCH domain-containing protein n=1 Tax=marine sediment metagenome TaxID=412755 RepID=A0A0F9SR05_9ZZZZ
MKGIIMSGNHPKLILDGIKTQTRRTWGLEKINQNPNRYSRPDVYKGISGDWFAWFGDNESSNPVIVKCPYGGVGDHLWVRETWAVDRQYNNCRGSSLPEDTEILFKGDLDMAFVGKWRPSIHMPRWASRITLEITEVRVERVQEITEKDAKAEGVDTILQFSSLWDTINKARGYSWDVNPFCWVLSFKNVD